MSRRFVPIAAVVLVAACGGDDSLPAVEGPTRPRLELVGTEMRYDPAEIALAAGEVEVVLHNEGLVVHDIRVEGLPRLLVEAAPGATGTATWSLEEGRYRIYCSLPGHRAAGMEGLLELR